MQLTKIFIAGLVGGTFAFLAGWIIFGILLKDIMSEGMNTIMRAEEEMVFWAMILSNVLWATTIAWIFVQWAKITTWQGGAIAGAILGFLITASFDFGFYAMTTMFSITDLIRDITVNTIWVALMGAVIGWWLGWKK